MVATLLAFLDSVARLLSDAESSLSVSPADAERDEYNE